MDKPLDRSRSEPPVAVTIAACLLALAAAVGAPVGLELAAAGETPESERAGGGSPSRDDAGSGPPSGGSAPDAGPSHDAGVPPDAIPPGGRPSPSAEKLLEEAGAIAGQVARIRGLPALRSIDKGVKNREELRKLLVQKLEEKQSTQQLRREAAVLRKLGLIPRDLDYRETILDVLTEQIAGFYDQESDKLNIMEGIPLDLQRPAMAHEIFHAIQDQHFDLTQMMKPFTAREHGDFHLARSALVEGDATILMIDYTLYEKGTLPRDDVRSIVDIPMMANMLEQLKYGKLGALEKLNQGPGSSERSSGSSSGDRRAAGATGLSSSALDDAPAIVRRSLIFPYLAGMRFVIALRSGHTWEEFNRIYDRPPVSTEQILHPERYSQRDEPVMLSSKPGAVLDSYDKIYETVLGEFQMRLFLQHHLRETQNRAGNREIDPVGAATGWDGDRLYAFRNEDGKVLLAHQSVWDTTQDAVEYYNALVEINERRFSDATSHTQTGKHGSSVCMHFDDEPREQRIYVERWGDAVLHIEGAPTNLGPDRDERDPTTYRLREQIWKTTSRRPFRAVYRERMAAEEGSADANP